jgi:hypothetical protein
MLSAEKLAALGSGSTLTDAQLVALTPAQVSALTFEQLSGLSANQIALLSVEQLSALSYWQIRALTPERNTVLSAAQLAALNKPFTEEGVNAVTASIAMTGRDGDVGLLDLAKAVQSGTSNYATPGMSSWAWRFIEGQQIPAWLQLGSSGLLRAAAPESVLAGGSVAATAYWAEGFEVQQGVVKAPRYAKGRYPRCLGSGGRMRCRTCGRPRRCCRSPLVRSTGDRCMRRGTVWEGSL